MLVESGLPPASRWLTMRADLPDTISTDLTFTSATNGPVFDLLTTMSKLLHFGMPLDDLVTCSTAAPAKILGYEGRVW
jgi:dihydroorotase